MISRRCSCWIVLTGVLILCVVVQAEDEQWLQYRSGQDASSTVGGLNDQNIRLTPTKPEGVNLPQLKEGGPLFGKWASPMAKAGFLWFALDRSTPKGVWDRLYIDSNGDGKLSDETAIKPYQRDTDQARFGPVKVVLQGEDGPVSFHLCLQVYISGGDTYCYASAAGWYEGDISIDGVKTHCMVVDYTANGTFNDTSLDPSKADRIAIGSKALAGETSCQGRFVDVNGTLYELEVAKDGAYVKVKKAQDVTYGQVRVPAGISRLTLTGTNGQFRPTPKDQVVRAPVGKYCMTEWAIDRKDDKGKKWTAQGQTNGVNARWTLDVAEGKEVALDIGEPFVSQLVVRSTGANHTFQQRLLGRLGESITLSLGGSNDRPAPPKLVIRCNEGGYERTLNFAYG